MTSKWYDKPVEGKARAIAMLALRLYEAADAVDAALDAGNSRETFAAGLPKIRAAEIDRLLKLAEKIRIEAMRHENDLHRAAVAEFGKAGCRVPLLGDTEAARRALACIDGLEGESLT